MNGFMALAFAASLALPAPAQDSQPFSRALEIVGRGAQIGVSVRDTDPDDAKGPRSGALIESVTPGGPADKAGIKPGDVITDFDGERVRSATQFSRLVTETSPGHAVSATVVRGGNKVNVTVTPDQRGWSDDFRLRLLDVPRAPRVPAMPTPAPRPSFRFEDFPTVIRSMGSGRRLGITIESIDDQFAEYFGVKEGVLVKSVLEGSTAQKAGLKAGDVITAINGTKVYETSDINRAIERLDNNVEFTIELMRDRKSQTLKGKMEGSETRSRPRIRTRL